MPKIPIGTQIKFVKELTEGPDDEHPALLFARVGELGEIVGHDTKEGYRVKSLAFDHDSPFGASEDKFVVYTPPVETVEQKQVPGVLVRQAFETDWCPRCKTVVDMLAITTYLPGIIAKRCCVCHLSLQANYLEDIDEFITVPATYVFPDPDPNFKVDR